jgi:ATP-dependent protease ClpP protease subunit
MKKELNARKVNHDNSSLFVDDGINIKDRIIHLFDDIDSDSIGKVIKGVQLMLAANKEPIDIYISSLGGDPYSAWGAANFITLQKDVLIRTHAMGPVMSAATIVFLSGDEKICYENSVFMFHTVSDSTSGKFTVEIKDCYEECKRIHEDICEFYGKYSKTTSKEWAKLLKANDLYIRPEQALEMGIVDRILKPV